MKALAIVEFSKIKAKIIEKFYDSQVKAKTWLHKFQLKLTYKSTKKTMSKLVDKYMEEKKLLVKRLKIMKNKINVFIFIFLSQISIIQKR